MKIKNSLFILGVWIVIFNWIPHAKAEQMFDIRINFFSDQGYLASSQNINPPPNFQTKFNPSGGGGGIEKEEGGGFWEIGLGIELTYEIFGSWKMKIGIPIQYSISAISFDLMGGINERIVSKTYYHWWDKVTVVEVKQKRTTPAIGLLLAIPVKREDYIFIQYTFQFYEMSTWDFRGIDHVGSTNTSKRSGPARDHTRGVLHRIEIRGLAFKKSHWSIGVIGEFDGKGFWLVGIGIKFSLSLFK